MLAALARTKVRHPRASGRAERFIATLQRESAYRDAFGQDAERDAVALFVARYDTPGPHRFRWPHGAGLA